MAEARYKNIWTFLIESNYGDAADIGSDMRCAICTRILINAHNSVCGCRYCLECVKAYLNGKRRFCPGNTDDCKVEQLDIDSNIYPDHAMNYRISKLIVSCRYSCGCRCELRNMEEHERACQRQPVDCPYVNMGCRETRLVTDRINEHLVGENESHARLLMSCIERFENEIASTKRDTVELQSEMAEMRLAREIDEARARETNELVDQIKQEVRSLRNETKLLKVENNSLKEEIQKYRSEYLELVVTSERQLTEIQIQKQTHAREMEVTEKCSRIEEKLGEIEWQTRKEKEELMRHIDEVREKHAIGLANIEKQVSENAINNDMQNWVEYVWPIDGWAAKCQSARDGSCVEIFSDPFYSHKNGYKMRLSVSPDGLGIGKATHLSVFYYLMRGPYDNILSWPFKRTVTLSIINLQTGIDHVSPPIIYQNDRNEDCYMKPATETNRGLGRHKLIELTELSTNAGLCRDDKIFIRCVVN